MTAPEGETAGRAGYAQDVRDAIDRIDETPFGKIGKLFDRMADDAQRAVNEQKHLMEILDGLVLVCGRTGDAFAVNDGPGGCTGKYNDCDHCSAIRTARSALLLVARKEGV